MIATIRDQSGLQPHLAGLDTSVAGQFHPGDSSLPASRERIRLEVRSWEKPSRVCLAQPF
jgi:hypothetical protein